MSWATRRRAAYGGGVFLFFFVLIAGPLFYWYINIPPTCTDGIQNQDEVSVDRGGPCVLLDAAWLDPSPILWARSFSVRQGLYNSVAYIQNSNDNAGIQRVSYRFALYDTANVLVAERTGSTFVMPGSVTPVFESNIQTGNRHAVRTYFIYTEEPVWYRMKDRARLITINDKKLEEEDTSPTLSATALNTSVDELRDIEFIATVFDQAGNAFATSRTIIEKLRGGEKQTITFTWPARFEITVGRIDIIPVVEPVVTAKP